MARRDGRTVATDVLRTAGRPHAIDLTADRKSAAADGRSLCFVTAEVVDARGVVVPGADHGIAFDVAGGSLAGLDNGREESAEHYQASTRTAFHGKALAIVRSGVEAGPLKVTARADGPRAGTVTVRATPARSKATTPPAEFAAEYKPAPNHPFADASYSGRLDTIPAAMLDGDPATGWSNAFSKAATALLPAFNGARAKDWVSVHCGRPRTVDGRRSPSPSAPRTPCPPRSRCRSGRRAVGARRRDEDRLGDGVRRALGDHLRRSPSTRCAGPGCGS